MRRSSKVVKVKHLWLIALALFNMILLLNAKGQETPQPIRNVITFNGSEREYFIWLPQDYDSVKTYWMVVIAHGGGNVNGGETFWMIRPVWKMAAELGLDAILVTPTFHKPDPIPERYPVEEGQFLVEIIGRVKEHYKVHQKILLTGYSRGGQFSHRFALWYPEYVKACAPFAAGSWTTPDGSLLVPGLGVIDDPEAYLSNPENRKHSPAQVQDPNVAKLAGKPASPGAQDIPFLVMCGSLDERFEMAKAFAQSLQEAGYHVETEWPRTPHGGRSNPEYKKEFDKYVRGAVEFFVRHTKSEN